MWNSQNNIYLLLNVEKYRSVGSVARVAQGIEVSERVKLITTCIQWIKGIDDALKEKILSLPKLEYIHPSQLETVKKVLPMFESQHRDTWNLIPDEQKVCIQLCQELIRSDVTKVEYILKQLDSPPSSELTNSALDVVARKTGISIPINKQLTTGEIAPLVRQLIEHELLFDEVKRDDGGYFPPSFDTQPYSKEELIKMDSLIRTSASKVPCGRLPKPCIDVCERMIRKLHPMHNTSTAIKSGFLFGLVPFKLNCVLLASVIKRKEATESNFGHSDFDSITLARSYEYEKRTVESRKKYAETFLNTFQNHSLYQRFDIYHDFYEDVLDLWYKSVKLENVEIFFRSFTDETLPPSLVHDKIMDIFVHDSVRNLVILSVPIWLKNSQIYSSRKTPPFPRHDTETVDLVFKHILKFKNLKAIKLVLSSPWIVNYPNFQSLLNLCKERTIYFEIFFKQGTTQIVNSFMERYLNRRLFYKPLNFDEEDINF